MTSVPRPLVSVVGLVAAALLVAGCTTGPGSETPTSSPAPSAGNIDDQNDMEGALLDDGRMFAVITVGSSTCVPQVDQVTAEGQTVTVTLVDPEGESPKPCTKDLAPRASLGALPEGVDPTADITLNVTYGDITDDVDIDGDPAAAGTPGASTEYLPSAGWFDDGGLVLLTWGSSSCPPVVESLEGSGNSGTATFVTDANQVCTMDMAPRATMLDFSDDTVEDDGTFTLTLVGGGLDGTVEVRQFPDYEIEPTVAHDSFVRGWDAAVDGGFRRSQVPEPSAGQVNDVLVLLDDAIDNNDYPGADTLEWIGKAKAHAANLVCSIVP